MRKLKYIEKEYFSPVFDILEIQFEQNILGGSGNAGDLGIEELDQYLP